ncbi:hypothetical protein PISMIDRAFT_683009 [Pisolithus microcarpus 441]|uniref:Uncharacterized protein n=1 Tax=Pisolithus microcarpus 441 TaxID=765257 RepID=A0A0C9YZZ7_9AGAM|nr:hypothetical protein PISMIDRAFT_683009 [Pisolithus microcarpus 441]
MKGSVNRSGRPFQSSSWAYKGVPRGSVLIKKQKDGRRSWRNSSRIVTYDRPPWARLAARESAAAVPWKTTRLGPI